jgi:hypothetical protein
VCEITYFRQKSGASFELTHTLKTAEPDLLILGSSRALHHYDSSVFKSELNLATHNAGRDGQGFLFHHIVAATVLERHRPKIIIVDILHDDLVATEGESSERLSVFSPYLAKEPLVGRLLNKRQNSSARIANMSNLYRYNSKLVPALCHVLRPSKPRPGGYRPLNGELPTGTKIEPAPPMNQKPDAELVQAMRSVCEMAGSKNTKVIGVMSPVYRIPDRAHFGTIKELMDDYGVEIWDYMNHTEFMDPSLFADTGHLNSQGAEAFSRVVALRIKELYVD